MVLRLKVFVRIFWHLIFYFDIWGIWGVQYYWGMDYKSTTNPTCNPNSWQLSRLYKLYMPLLGGNYH